MHWSVQSTRLIFEPIPNANEVAAGLDKVSRLPFVMVGDEIVHLPESSSIPEEGRVGLCQRINGEIKLLPNEETARIGQVRSSSTIWSKIKSFLEKSKVNKETLNPQGGFSWQRVSFGAGGAFLAQMMAHRIIKTWEWGYELITGKKTKVGFLGDFFINIGTNTGVAVGASRLAGQKFAWAGHVSSIPQAIICGIPIALPVNFILSKAGPELSPHDGIGKVISGGSVAILGALAAEATVPAWAAGAAASVPVIGSALLLIGKGILVGLSLAAGYAVGTLNDNVPNWTLKGLGLVDKRKDYTYSNMIASGYYSITGDKPLRAANWVDNKVNNIPSKIIDGIYSVASSIGRGIKNTFSKVWRG